MFRNLVVEKKNVISYLITLLVSFGTALFGVAPFSAAVLGALIDNKIPIIFSFIISFVVYFARFGLNSAIRLLTMIIIYALFISILKNKESKSKKALLFVLSGLISIIFVILIGLDKTPNISLILFELFISTFLMIIFSAAIKANIKIKNKEIINSEELIAIGLLFVILFSSVAIYKYAGLTLFSIACVATLMLLCWKKTIKFTIASSISIAIIFLMVTNEPLVYLPLFLVAGFASMLLSKAGRKGIIIGLAFTLFYLLLFAPTKDKVYSQLGYNRYVMEDFNTFLKEQNGTNETMINGVDFYDLDKIVEEIINTPYVVIMKEMLIGFAVLLILPNSFYKSYENITKEMLSKYESNGTGKFEFYKIYLLDPPKEEEKPKEKKTTKKKTNKRKKS